MQNARIFIIVCNEETRVIIIGQLEEAGHRVLIEAADMETACRFIEKGYVESEGIQVAVLQGNLTSHSRNCEHGRDLAVRIRHKKPSVKIVAYSARETAFPDYADAYAGSNPSHVARLISGLPE